MVWNLRSHGERLSKCKTIKQVDGLAQTTKAKASPARGKQDKGKGEGKQDKGKGKGKSKG